MFAAGSVEDALKSYSLAENMDGAYITIGVHPCRATEVIKDGMTVEDYQARIESTIEELKDRSKLVAIGECGLDYDRFNYADKET